MRFKAVDAPAGGFNAESGFSLSGTLADGQTLTLTKTGGGFGTKPNGAKPLYWLPLTSTKTFDASLSRGSVGALAGDLVAEQLPAGSSVVLKRQMNGGRSGGGLDATDFAISGAPGKVYTNIKKYYAFSQNAVADLNTKSGYEHSINHKLMQYFFSYNTPFMSIEPCSVNGDGSARYDNQFFTYNYPGEYGPSRYGVGSDNDPNQWCVHETLFSRGTLDTADAVIRHLIDTRDMLAPSNLFTAKVTGETRTPDTLHLDMYFNYTIDADLCLYVDHVYIDDSWCRVAISDETSYQTQTWTGDTGRYRREIQIPTAWADGELSFVCRQGAHASLSGKTLYVVTNAGTAIKAGVFA
jgi:hypothetical protein